MIVITKVNLSNAFPLKSWNIEPKQILSLRVENNSEAQTITSVVFLHDLNYLVTVDNLGYLKLVCLKSFKIKKVVRISKSYINWVTYLADGSSIVFSNVNLSDIPTTVNIDDLGLFIFNFQKNKLKKLKLNELNNTLNDNYKFNTYTSNQIKYLFTLRNLLYAYDGETLILNICNHLVIYNFKLCTVSNTINLDYLSKVEKLENVIDGRKITSMKLFNHAENTPLDCITFIDYDYKLKLTGIGFYSGKVIVYEPDQGKTYAKIVSNYDTPILGIKFVEVKGNLCLAYYYQITNDQALFNLYDINQTSISKSIQLNNIPTSFNYCNDNKTIIFGFSQGVCVLKNIENKLQKDLTYSGDSYNSVLYLNNGFQFVSINSKSNIELWEITK